VEEDDQYRIHLTEGNFDEPVEPININSIVDSYIMGLENTTKKGEKTEHEHNHDHGG
jgi:hypothetical protein